MKNFSALVRGGITLFLFISITLFTVTPVASQSGVSKIVITSVNVNEAFPEVRVQVKPLDAEGAFIPSLAASQFSLREDGESLSISEVRSASLPLDLRVVFVIDELVVAPHLTTIREAIQSFAENQMQSGAFVEVLAAADGRKTQTIVPLTGDPEEVINGIGEANYNPASSSSTDLLGAVDQALTDLSALSENIEGLNTVVVFSVSIIDQLDLNETIQSAVQSATPIHTVLLGGEDAKGALGRLARETQAGNGAIPPEDLDDVFDAIIDQRDQDQYLITYRSKADRSGDHELVVTVAGASSNAITFALDELEPPLVTITAPATDTVITRTESIFNQVEPTEQTVAVEINWPDGHPREIVLETTVLVVNGKSLGPATAIRDNGKDPVILEFTWDLREEKTPGTNEISLVIEAEDELGLKGRSEPLPVTLEYVQIENACPPLISDNFPALCSNFNLLLPLGSLIVALVALVLVVVFLRRNPKIQQQVKQRLGTMMTRAGGARETRMVEPLEPAKATLVVVEGNSGTNQTEFRLNKTTTIGRSSEHAELVLQSDKEGSPISRLQCTLLEKESAFDLRDEGSSNGTFLNGVRLKSGELHRLSDGDIVELAPIRDGGVKFKFQSVLKTGYMGTRLVSPKSNDSDDDITPDGYIPTKPMN